nr:ATP-dependent DNA helicase RecG [Corynebacterium lactis]
MLGWLGSDYARTPLNIVVGPKTAKKLQAAYGAETVADALTIFPKRYVAQGKSLNVSWSDLGDTITTVVEVDSILPAPERGAYDRKRPLKLVVSDGSRRLPVAIFGQEWLRKVLYPGIRLLILGTLSEFRGDLQIKNVDCLVLHDDGTPGAATGKLATLTKTAQGLAEMQRLLTRPYLPIYRGRKGVAGIHMALYMQRILEWLPLQPEPLPNPPLGLPTFDDALRGAHFPTVAGPAPALDRLKYDEALELQLAVGKRREIQGRLSAPVCKPLPGGVREQLRAGLPFSLTDGQSSVASELEADLEGGHPMNRLLAGEVGSGKTVVALMGMAQAIDAGRQCALLAPTEVLAQQHHRSITAMLERAGVDVNVRLLTGSLPTAERRQTLLEAVSGEADIVVGTHALLSEGVEFFDLGLVVVDEQHRFGVRQRDRLRSRGRGGLTPHLLVMTATPIPRTVAMTIFGDLAVSQLTELPAGRKEIQTFVVPTVELPRWEERTWERIGEDVAAGNRAFIVCPRITADPEQYLDESVESVLAKARAKLPGARVGELHGQMDPEDKDRAMQAFAAGDLDVLVSTTVIEVGVDVPEATIMMIRRAESFGISQIHQLRGRVGRGDHGGLCFLCTHTHSGTPERARLDRIAATTDGVELAELDLATRSFGDLLGDDQSGIATGLGLVDLTTDAPSSSARVPTPPTSCPRSPTRWST